MADAPLPELAANYGGFDRLAAGPLGETWRARDTQTGQDVILKIRQLNEAASRYFQRELELTRLLTHPRLQPMRTSLQTPSHLVMVYDYIPGVPLSAELRTSKLAPERALQIALQLLDALSTIHKAGFIYRDLSPQNIIMRGPYDPVLIDFNAIGQLTEDSRLGQSTIVGELSGKPLYMSPEQLAAAPQTASSDIWTLGAVLYEMLAGFPYRMGGSLAEILGSASSAAPPDVSAAPAEYHDILAKLLATDPAQRPDFKAAYRALSKLHGAATGNAVASGIGLDDFEDLLKKDFGGEKRQFSAKDVKPGGLSSISEPFGLDDPPPAAQSPAPHPVPSAPKPMPIPIDGAAPNPWNTTTMAPVNPAPAPPPQDAKVKSTNNGLQIAIYAVMLVGYGLFLAQPDLLPDNLKTTNPKTLSAFLFIGFALAAVGAGHQLSRRVHTRASDVRSALPFQAVDLISSDNARDQLSTTICIEIDAYRAAAAGTGDDILTITMVAAAQEYRDADSTDDRIKALQMLTDLNAKISSRLKPWWLDYEKLVARGISLISLLAGAVALFKAAQTLI